jgi:folate-dependent phosphoribosylglycinamide formyltransferase PurN
MDCGPVILRREVAIRGNDTLETLADRVHQAEDAILPQAINIACARILDAKNQSGALG